mmetsp:Transcript_2224/g.1991  ORF Transcript_2224/g.1991 Transcript_2224/m.1991 type:complete len:98 (-) Transcript_2224:136-429(-)
MKMIPDLITSLLEAKVSLSRIEKFLFAEELNSSIITHKTDQDDPYALQIENGSFYWITEKEKLISAEKNKPEYQNKADDEMKKILDKFEKTIPKDIE